MFEQAGSRTEPGRQVIAHHALRELLDSPHTPLGRLRAQLPDIRFVAYRDLAAETSVLTRPLLMPSTTEFQNEELRAVRLNQATALIVAVTHDVSGHQAYHAIRSGADLVFNLANPSREQLDAVCARCVSHSSAVVGLSQHSRSSSVEAAGEVRPDGHPGPYDEELLRLLGTSLTVSEIARRFYCSERTMYRRIRHLYDAFGVSRRSELMAAVSRANGRPNVVAGRNLSSSDAS
ncbi:helix-turn-helix transcriptional regulator [Streptomyces sulphureus]|uniref:helix-turn-helix transcriptional regulator n=1 Tax=Streptomyces sulphureus TaxID=47758 RepID=UPI0003605385|nr:response regulator transcription factor [Streptomyces sulphureus]